MRVSTGGVIDQDQIPGANIPQLDTIAWIPGPVAAIFEVGDFGLVPRSSCLGFLEIKSSAYGKTADKLDEWTSPAFEMMAIVVAIGGLLTFGIRGLHAGIGTAQHNVSLVWIVCCGAMLIFVLIWSNRGHYLTLDTRLESPSFLPRTERSLVNKPL